MDLHSKHKLKLNANQQNWPSKVICRWALKNLNHNLWALSKMHLDRSTSSAYIAVDRKHYLHYKHFSTAETVLLGMTNKQFLFWNNHMWTVQVNQVWCVTPKTKILNTGGEQAGHHQFCIDLHNSSILVVQLCKTSRELRDNWAQLVIKNGLVAHITAPYARRST